MANKEIWKPVSEYEAFYEVSNLGRVRSIPRVVEYSDGRIYKYKARILLKRLGNHGYPVVTLSKCRRAKTMLVHRIVADSFIKNPYGKRAINHKNGIKTDNRLSNIERSTDSENMQHAYDNGLNHNGSETLKTGRDCKAFKRAIQVELNGYGSVMFGNKQMVRFGFDPVGIWRFLKGLRRTHRGYFISPIEA